MTFDLDNFQLNLQICTIMTCSLLPENRYFLDQLPLDNIWSNSTCDIKNIEFRVPGIAAEVKDINCIIFYSDILNYKHVTKYIFC